MVDWLATQSALVLFVGVVAGLYAVMVAFVIVNEWQSFADAQAKTSDESAALAATYAAASTLNEPARSEIQGAVLHYVNTLVCDEFPPISRSTPVPTVAPRTPRSPSTRPRPVTVPHSRRSPTAPSSAS